MPLCIYAVVPAPASSSARYGGKGFRGERLSLVRAGRLAAVVGVTTRRPRPSVQTLRDYHRAIERLSSAFDAMLPVRFGSVVTDVEEIRLVLQHRQEALRRALAQVRRRVQMTVRILLPAGRPASQAVPPDVSSGSAYLRSRAAEQRQRDGGDARAALASAVRRYVRAERIDTRGRVVSVYHLLARSSVAPYLRAFDRIRASGTTFTVSGPFPPFAFAEPLSAAASS